MINHLKQSRVWALLLAVPLLAAGCDKPNDGVPSEPNVTSQDVRREVGEAVETTGDYLSQQAAEYRRAMEARLADLDARLRIMNEQASGVAQEHKGEWNARIARLEQDLKRTREQLSRQAGEGWESFKSGMDTAATKLEESYREAEAWLNGKK